MLARVVVKSGFVATAFVCILVVLQHETLTRLQYVWRLLQGRWDYDDAGLLARANLRWFTQETARRAFGESGLGSVDVFDKVFDADLATGFVDSLTPALDALATDPAEYGRRATPLRHVWRAWPRAPEELKIVSTMLPPVGGVTEVRVFDPMRCLATKPGVACILSNGREFPAFDPDTPRIFIFHRPAFIGAEGYRAVEPLLASGYVVVTEFDDHPDFITIRRCEAMFNFSAVHAVQTTTDALADVLGRAQAPSSRRLRPSKPPWGSVDEAEQHVAEF